MASRRSLKQQARAQRIERERQLDHAAQRRRRLQIAGGVASIAIVVVAVGIARSSSGAGKVADSTPASPGNRAAAKRVETLLAGIPQSSGNVLGKRSAPVTVTEFGDLECSVCDEFDIGAGVSSPGGAKQISVIEQAIAKAA